MNELKIKDNYDILKRFLKGDIDAAEFVGELREIRSTEDVEFEVIEPLQLPNSEPTKQRSVATKEPQSDIADNQKNNLP